jgi:hypothetical protein
MVRSATHNAVAAQVPGEKATLAAEDNQRKQNPKCFNSL